MFLYFNLQYKMLNRHISNFGLHPFWGYLLSFIIFIGFSLYLFYRTAFAPFIYIFIALGFVYRLSEKSRNDFISQCFNERSYYKIRIVENLFCVMPFIIILLVHLQFLSVLLLVVLSTLLAFRTFSQQLNISIPTPFYKKPFEFIVGFRSSWFLLPLIYFVTIMAVIVKNLNLGIFTLFAVFVLSFSFYLKPEDSYFVWIFKQNPKGFLWNKIKTAALHSTYISLPITVILCIVFKAESYYIAGFHIAGYLLLSLIILTKYSVYPQQINIPQLIIFVSCVGFPPLLLIVIPYLYIQSVKHLKAYLHN